MGIYFLGVMKVCKGSSEGPISHAVSIVGRLVCKLSLFLKECFIRLVLLTTSVLSRLYAKPQLVVLLGHRFVLILKVSLIDSFDTAGYNVSRLLIG
jgi:hypothetical protein